MSARKTVKSSLRSRFAELKARRNVTPQQRGFELEKILFDLAMVERLSPLPSYRLSGEQIDGMLELEGRFVLIETSSPTAKTFTTR
jgi:hypothetical protein